MRHHETPDWVRDAVFYQIFPDRFAASRRVPKPANLEPWDAPPTLHGFKGGDLVGVSERLDYLGSLGVNTLYLNPIFASAANHRYHTHDYFQVDPILGGGEAFDELLAAARERHLRVILDGVFNHTGRSFYQFSQTLENGLASPYVDWFHFNREWLEAGRQIDAYGTVPRRHEAPAAETSLERHGFRAWWDIPALPKLDTSNPEVRAFLFQVAEHWVRRGIDGWRLDVPSEIDDDAFWREFRRRVKAARPDAYIVGEIWDDARRWLAGDQFDGVTNYLFGRAVLGFCLGEGLNREELDRSGLKPTRPLTAEDFAGALETVVNLYPRDAVECQLNVVSSHDTPRLLTMASGDEAGVKLVFTCLFSFPGAPCLYYGEEIGMAGGHDPDCRRGFEWDERLWNLDLLAHVRLCIAARRASPALRRGDFRVVLAEDGVIAYARRFEGEQAVVCVNASTREREVDLPVLPAGTEGLVGFFTGERVAAEDGGRVLRVVLPPRSSGVWLGQVALHRP